MKLYFDGQQDGERVLYAVRTHSFVHALTLIKIFFIALGIMVLFWLMAGSTQFNGWFRLIGILLGTSVGLLGWWGVTLADKKTITYITDRRVVRFSATNPWVSVTRTIPWEEVVKIKTYTSNMFMRVLGVGTVVIHARSTVVALDTSAEQYATNDDITIEHVGFYQDLGHYLDKIMYVFKHDRDHLGDIRSFVPQPKGKRYL